MLENISNLGKSLNKNEQKLVNGGLKIVFDICGLNYICSPGYHCANQYAGDLTCIAD
ncbi:hypothetical protein [Aquimarina sp. SS2-1]|uniref:hypothetical protein n=1 Tax=Aquimarina besae TaxID=3342247 RepID=UPI00366BF2AF